MNRTSTITLAFSPCPNDTFMFHGIAEGSLALQGHDIEVHMHDVETLNRKALSGMFDFSKLSIHAFLKLKDKYCMLNSGNTLGYGCGPLVVARKNASIDDISKCKVAIPGELTTAHLLFQLWAPGAANKVFMPFDRIMESVIEGEADAGVIIHEGRFTYEGLGLEKVVDLGEWWQTNMNLPLPLGCIAAKHSVGEKARSAFDSLLKQSIEQSFSNPDSTYKYVRKHAQELDDDVLQAHIDTYVNEFSINLTNEGREAVKRLEEEAIKIGVLR